MNRALGVINLITVMGGILLLVLSLWPGYTGGCWTLLALPLILLLGLAWFIVILGRTRSTEEWSCSLRFRQAAVAPLAVCLTLVLLATYVPRRLAFRLVSRQFESHLATAPMSRYEGQPLGWIGIYHVEQYAADPRGGVYYCTGTGGHGFGPDRMYYGFVYRPNAQGTPFGAARYRVWPLHGEWYWFRASDDWH